MMTKKTHDPVETVRRDGRTIFIKMYCHSCGADLPDSEFFANCCTDCYNEKFGGPRARPGRRGEMTNPYDAKGAQSVIERLAAMQSVPILASERKSNRIVVKDAIQVIGEQVDTIDHLRTVNAELVAACEALIRHWEDDAGEVLAWDDDRQQDPGAKVMLDCARDLRQALARTKGE